MTPTYVEARYSPPPVPVITKAKLTDGYCSTRTSPRGATTAPQATCLG